MLVHPLNAYSSRDSVQATAKNSDTAQVSHVQGRGRASEPPPAAFQEHEQKLDRKLSRQDSDWHSMQDVGIANGSFTYYTMTAALNHPPRDPGGERLVWRSG